MPPSETRPPTKKGIAHVFAGIRTVGLGRAILAGLYPFRRAYYEAKFSTGNRNGSILLGLAGLPTALRAPGTEERLRPHDFVLLGDVLSHSHEGQTVTVLCQNALLQLTVLAADLGRVRLSSVGAGRYGPVRVGQYGPSGIFSPIESYAVAKGNNEWAQTPHVLAETAEAIEIRTERMTCRIAKQPCRLSFWDSNERRIHADSSGLGWRGRKVARFARLEPGEHVYGLGEKAFPLDRRGRSYIMWNIDPQNYAPGDDPIYLNIPFYIGMHEGQGYGLFYDNSYRLRFDIGKTRPDEAIYLTDDGELRYYFFYGPALT